MSGSRKLSALEQRMHQAVLSASEKVLTMKELEKIAPDMSARTAALNFLLSTGMLKTLKDSKGGMSFRAVLKKELDVKKDMTGEEAMVLSHIQGAGNEGIWTKHIKSKTELHQTVLDRCLKSLVQKMLIKVVKSVKHPTRKIYMLAHLEPSVEITGGPWYSDNELDTEFIKLLCGACLAFIREKSFPKSQSHSSSSSKRLYPPSQAPSYPSAAAISHFLSSSKISTTELGVEHVESLLGVLVLDGLIEKLPAFGAALWESSMREGESDDDDASAREKKKKKEKGKAKKRSRDDSDEDSDLEDEGKRKKKRRRKDRGDSDSDEDSDDGKKKSKSKSKSKTKKRRKDDSSDEEASEEDEKTKKKRKGKKKWKEESSDESDDDESESDSEEEDRKKKKKSKKKRKASPSSSSETESDSHRHRSKSRSKSKSKRSSSPALNLSSYTEFDGAGGAHVYRAVHPETLSLGLSQAPCGRCPTFDFCKEGGPVNPKECVYYEGWFSKLVVSEE
ncbi:hypothetical protein JAAARDRAFT_41609 [Jaapia argillacea MUCL 33604]|uniref:DNA-directed RNA polymerase III subunit RPC6 n=1 Tax=Jaapia argillacea MUCL 33604 TaxID=933084 RepID=A0A067PKM1_9AGAM|nr:hypothetical protein JAAARDRAFT_41609 [Jaapia argillacea MUCL 33604]